MKNATIAVLSAVLFASPAFAEHGGEGHHGKRMEHFMKKIDTNGDGNITRAEHDAFSDSKFKKFDADGNGVVTPAEREAAKAKWEAKRAEYKAKKEQKTAD